MIYKLTDNTATFEQLLSIHEITIEQVKHSDRHKVMKLLSDANEWDPDGFALYGDCDGFVRILSPMAMSGKL